MPEKMLTLTVPLESAGDRIDKVLRQLHPEISRSQWQRLVRDKDVTINGQPIRANHKVAGGEIITAVLPPPVPSDIEPQNIPLDILYEDDDLMAINKPPNLVMHPAVGHWDNTLANAIIYHRPNVLNVGGERRPGMVHRLDKNTSGVVLVAKNDYAHNFIVNQFKKREIKKVYKALVDGLLKPEKALVDAPLGRDPENRKRMTVIEPGRNAMSQASQTSYEATEYFKQHTFVTCYPITGRTHQIRVHLAYVGYPIVGDYVYGRTKFTIPIDRHYLHAAQISFHRPSDNQFITIESPLTPQLQTILDTLRAEG